MVIAIENFLNLMFFTGSHKKRILYQLTDFLVGDFPFKISNSQSVIVGHPEKTFKKRIPATL